MVNNTCNTIVVQVWNANTDSAQKKHFDLTSGASLSLIQLKMWVKCIYNEV